MMCRAAWSKRWTRSRMSIWLVHNVCHSRPCPNANGAGTNVILLFTDCKIWCLRIPSSGFAIARLTASWSTCCEFDADFVFRMSFCDISDLIMTSHLGPGYKVCCHQHLDVIKRMKKRLFETDRSDICVTTVHPVFGKRGTKKHSSKRVKARTMKIQKVTFKEY